MRTLGVLALLLAPGLAAADDLLLIKEEMAAIRKELVAVRMDLRRAEARKQALAAKEKLSPDERANTAEFRAVLAGDEPLKALRKALAEAEHIIAISNNGKQLELGRQRAVESRKRIEERVKELLVLHQKREQVGLESRLVYLNKLRQILEKDLEALAKELKAGGG